MLQSPNMLQRQVNKYYGTKQEASARQVEAYRSHDRRDDHGDLEEEGVLVDIIIIIHQDTQP
jgi:hypothetical protein